MTKRRPIAGTADDPTIEFVTLELAGQTYKLAYDLYGIARAETAINGLRAPGEDKINLLHGLGALVAGAINPNESWLLFIDTRQLLGLFYGALLLDRPEMTLRDAARLMLPGALEAISNAVLEAYIAYMPEVKKIRELFPTTAGAGAGEKKPEEKTTKQKPGAASAPLPESTSA